MSMRHQQVARRGAASIAPLGILSAAIFLVAADTRMIDPLLPLLADQFGTTVSDAALVVTAYAIPYGLLQLLYGPLGDRRGKLRVMAAAMAVFALGTGTCALAPNFPALVFLRLLTGAAAAAIFPLALAYIGDTVPYAERQAAIGRLLGVGALGQILSASLGGVFGQFANWRGLFALCGVLAIPVAVVLRRGSGAVPVAAPISPGQRCGIFAPYRDLLCLAAARLVLGTVFLEGCLFFGTLAYLGAFLHERYALSFAFIGAIISGFGLGMLVTSRALRPLLAGLGERGLIGTGGGLVASGFVLLALVQTSGLVVPLVILLGVGFSMLHTTLQTRATELAPTARGVAIALFAFVVSIGQGLGAALVGRVVEQLGYARVFALGGGAIGLLAVALGLAWARLEQPVAMVQPDVRMPASAPLGATRR